MRERFEHRGEEQPAYLDQESSFEQGLDEALDGDSREPSEGFTEAQVRDGESRVNLALDGSPVSPDSKTGIKKAFEGLKTEYGQGLVELADGAKVKMEEVAEKFKDKLDPSQNLPKEFEPFKAFIKRGPEVRKVIDIWSYAQDIGSWEDLNDELAEVGVGKEELKVAQKALGLVSDGRCGIKTVNALSDFFGWGVKVRIGTKTLRVSEAQKLMVEVAENRGLNDDQLEILINQDADESIVADLPLDRLQKFLAFDQEFDFGLFKKDFQLLSELDSKKKSNLGLMIRDVRKASSDMGEDAVSILRYVFETNGVAEESNMDAFVGTVDFDVALALLQEHADVVVNDPQIALKIGSEIVKGERWVKEETITPEILDRYLDKTDLKGVILLKSRNVILASGNDVYDSDDENGEGKVFGSKALEDKLIESIGDVGEEGGGSLSHITTQSYLFRAKPKSEKSKAEIEADDKARAEAKAQASKLLDQIATGKSPLLFLFDGHGKSDKIAISSLKEGFIKPEKFAEAIYQRNKRFKEKSLTDIYVFDQCLANNYIGEVEKWLAYYEDQKGENVKTGGIFLTTIPPGLVSSEDASLKMLPHAELFKDPGIDLEALDKRFASGRPGDKSIFMYRNVDAIKADTRVASGGVEDRSDS